MTTLHPSGSAAEAPLPGPGPAAGRRGGLGRQLRARARYRRAGRPRWESPAFWALLAVTAVLYLYGLGSSGYANSFYSAAAQAGGSSWKAFLFGSLDAGNAITVDKPPAALWPMGLSVRLFGLGSWQILVPQALLGASRPSACCTRRYAVAPGPPPGCSPGRCWPSPRWATLMFRFNNPDALLCLLMVAALWCMGRAVEDGRTRWLVLAGACFGAGFLAKALQAWLILPVAALVYLVCGPTRLRNRIGQLLCGGLTTLVTAGWWVALVELWPASSRPYIGGSQENSFLELTFGYNGFGRLTGDETGSVGGGGGREAAVAAAAALGADGPGAAVQRHRGRSDLVAAAGRPAVPGRGAGAGGQGVPHGSAAGLVPAVGRLAAEHGCDLQLHVRDLPRLLHRRAGALYRGRGGHGGRRAVAGAEPAAAERGPGGGGRRDGGLGVRPAGPGAGLVPVAALGGAGRGCGGGLRTAGGRRTAPHPWCRGRRAGTARRGRRAGGLHGEHRRYAAHRARSSRRAPR